MSAFNKCKECGDTNPLMWVGTAKSLCGECAKRRKQAAREKAVEEFEAGKTPTGTGRSRRANLAMMGLLAGIAGASVPPRMTRP